jgi:hypothetical protein
MNNNTNLIAAVFIALGVAIAGLLIGRGFVLSRTQDRFVKVKGVAERDVTADLALWPLQVVATNDDLEAAQADLDGYVAEIKSFLKKHGIDASTVENQGLQVTDRKARSYGGQQQPETRFVVQQTVMVRTDDVQAVFEAGQASGELVEAGVVIASGSGYGPAQPTYLFNGLNDVKPEMIAEATAAAREAAEKFAEDAQSRLGGIRRANQGVFVILPRDQAPGIRESMQVNKTVRVVVTIDYYLR